MSFHKLKFFSITVILVSFFAGQPGAFAWPFGAKSKQTNAEEPAPAAASKPSKPSRQVRVISPSADSTDESAAGNQAEDTVQSVTIPEIPKIPAIPSIPKVLKPSQTIPKAAVQDPEVERIKKQIQDIIKINEGLKAHYADQAAEIQKIGEQAKIHQKILRDLETTRSQQKTSTNSEAYINQEKIRLIRNETEKHQKFIDALQQKEMAKSVKPAALQDKSAQQS